MIALHVHPSLKEVNKVVKRNVFSTLLRTCSQDGRSGVQGVSKGCLRGAPEDPNVAPALSNVADGPVKVAQECPRVPKGSPMRGQGRPSDTQESPKGVHGVPRASGMSFGCRFRRFEICFHEV